MTPRPGSHPGQPPGGSRLSTAAMLIGKAQGTEFPAEQEALALKAYTELAAYLNAVAPQDQAGRRRERRLLADRRGGGREHEHEGQPEGQPRVIDLRQRHAKSAYRSAAASPAVGAHLDLGL